MCYSIDWIKNKLKIASTLNNGGCEAGYAEAVIIICSIISGIASEIWPGKNNIDKKRFVELLVKYSLPNPTPDHISIPLLYLSEKAKGHNSNIKELERQFPCLDKWGTFIRDKIITCDDYKMQDNQVISSLNNLTLKNVRKYSYANVLYEQIRCGFLHCYMPNKLADDSPRTRRNVGISYTYRIDKKDRETNHKIYFHYQWIKDLIESMIKNDDFLKNYKQQPTSVTWWLDG